ncbi:MAG TPA: DUF465 domain-containing protein [Alphaproteobacteria bacterium]|nr:DUF465 domain-containing protein [Alphaproteobacteria bacterium]
MRLTEDERTGLKVKLIDLRSRHRALDDTIGKLTDEGVFDQIQLQRLKKEKLRLKDEITEIESQLLPDIIA